MAKRLQRSLANFARRKTLAILTVALLPLVLRAILLPTLPAPSPRVQDEFSHLLVADTFARGRLVNAVHPFWVHFESPHILVRPVYASAFPIAPGIALAIGQRLTGMPWAGVWISVAFMCAALCWMLQGWVSPGWAFTGGVLAALRFGVFSYWMNSYYGGALAAGAGALVLGAAGRMRKRRLWIDGIVMGVGLALLANSRPYEGMMFGSAIVAIAFWQSGGFRPAIVLPMMAILGVAGMAMAYYCARVTGNPFQLPYTFYRNTQSISPHFVFQSPRPEPVYHHRVLRHFYSHWEASCYRDARENRSPHAVGDKLMKYWRFFIGPVLTVPFVTLPWLWKRRRPRALLIALAFFVVSLLVEVWHAPHYAAPAAGLVLLLVVEGLRRLRWGAPPWVVYLIVLGSLIPVTGGSGHTGDGESRSRIQRQLEIAPGHHLVFVRYQLNHDPGDEWVYNSADIDTAKIVWAREMDPSGNRKLTSYFATRHVWLVEPDVTPPRLSTFDASLPPDPPFQFVKLGTEAIGALRSPALVRSRVLEKAGPSAGPRGCDHWNYLFYEATGVASPDPANGCYAGSNRAEPVSFEQWFAWLMAQN